MTDPVRVGFIGAGWPQRAQIDLYRQGGLEPRALCSRRRGHAERVAQDHGIPHVYETWKDLIAASDIDLVCVTTPPVHHSEMAIGALEAGKHVICQAPVLSVSEAEAMVRAAEKHPELLSLIDFELRMTPGRRRMRRLLREGAIGALLHVEMSAHSSDAFDRSATWTWEHDRDQGGGMLQMVASHLIDLALWMIGPIERATANLTIGVPERRYREGIIRTVTADDRADVLLTLAGGRRATGLITASALTLGEPGLELRLVGEWGTLLLDRHECLSLRTYESDRGWRSLERNDGAEPFTSGTLSTARALSAALTRNDLDHELARFEDGLAVQQILDRVRSASPTGAERTGGSDGMP